MKTIKIAYIGGGSKLWARSFMQDLALAEGICGEVALYDIDIEAARRNQRIAQRIHALPHSIAPFTYTVAGESYSGKRWVMWKKRCPVKGEKITVHYEEGRPEKFAVIISGGAL